MNEIAYLKNLNFKKVEIIEELKTSRGQVVFFNKTAKDFSKAPKMVEPDLRYFWDEDKFGIHVSDCEFSGNELVSIFQEIGETILNQMQILSWTRTKLDGVYFADREFSNLTYINFSNNSELKTFGLKIPKALLDFQIDHCPKLERLEILGNGLKLKKIDASFCSISNFPKLELIDLEYLNIQNNKIDKIDLSSSNNLMFLFAKANPLTEIKWPQNFSQISVIEVDEVYVGDDSMKVIYKYTDEKLKLELNAYLNQLKEAGLSDFLLRIKLTFLGNTTSGKSTLRRIFLSKKGNEKTAALQREESTHGVNVFNKKLNVNGKKIWIQGFDFGGQDYYHSTHLPFMGHNSLNILVYGLGDLIPQLGYNAYKFASKVVEGRSEILFPVNYWISSLKKNETFEIETKSKFIEFLENGYYQGKKFDFKDVLVNVKNDKYKIYLTNSKLEIVQNVFNNSSLLELNNLDLKENSGVKVGNIVSLDFLKHAEILKNWLVEKIVEHAAESHFLRSDEKLLGWLQKEKKVIYEPLELFESLPSEIKYTTVEELTSALRRLDSHHFGYYFESKKYKDKSFYINKLNVFSQWIHKEILTKKLIVDRKGYFEIKDLKLSRLSTPQRNKLIDFLETNNIIFKVKVNDTKKQNLQTYLNIDESRWVAPSYLPVVESISDNLLLESFELPDCIFEFNDFFHNNIVLQIFDEFEDNLILDPTHKQYIIWKNKILLHQSKGKNQKAYLLIELKFPGELGFDGLYPQLSISRNVSGFIPNSIFGKVFGFVKDKVANFNPVITVKTRFNNYIPYETLFQKNTQDGKVKSNLIFYNQTLYSVFDFGHFLKEYPIEPTKIFIGYSKFDIEYVEELLLHLGPYKNQGEIEVFYDKELKMGEKWDDELKHQLSNSDIFVCLVSPNMLNTQYVVDLEIPLAYENDIEIVPIILAECNWTYQKLNNGENLLKENNSYAKAKPLPSNKYERSKEWKEIAEKLKNKPSKNNGTNPSNSSAPADEHIAGDNKENG